MKHPDKWIPLDKKKKGGGRGFQPFLTDVTSRDWITYTYQILAIILLKALCTMLQGIPNILWSGLFKAMWFIYICNHWTIIIWWFLLCIGVFIIYHLFSMLTVPQFIHWALHTSLAPSTSVTLCIYFYLCHLFIFFVCSVYFLLHWYNYVEIYAVARCTLLIYIVLSIGYHNL